MSSSSNRSFDAIVVGSGAGGSAAAHRLVRAGLSVAIFEKGEDLPRDSSTLDFEKVVRDGAFLSRERWLDGKGRAFAPEEHFNVGGKTKWYGAALLRFGRHEFSADEAHQCRGWPFGYDELASYYDEAEQLLGVREFPLEPDLERIIGKLAERAPEWRSAPLQLGLSASILHNRLEAGHFDGFASVAGLKADAERAFLAPIRRSANAAFFTGAPVAELLRDEDDALRVNGVRLQDGRVFRAPAVLLAAGALHSPRLFKSFVDMHSLAGALPGYSHIGANLKLHLLTAIVALSSRTQDDLLRKTAFFVNDALPHSSVQPLGFDGELIATLIPRAVPRAIAGAVGRRSYGFFLQTEDGSCLDNRVGDSRDGERIMDYDAARSRTASVEHAQLVRRFSAALLKVGFVPFSKRIGLAGTAHACGTLIAGNDAAESVVDANGRAHGLKGLYVVDGSVLPRSSRVNPSLTIYAWALRVAERLAASLAARSTSELEMAL